MNRIRRNRLSLALSLALLSAASVAAAAGTTATPRPPSETEARALDLFDPLGYDQVLVAQTTGPDPAKLADEDNDGIPDAEDEVDGDGPDGPADPEQLETITVTGTRIPRAGFDTLEPAIVVDAEYIKDRGLTNVADALNEIPGFGVGVTPEGGQSGFGVAVNFVNRFGLGSNRTLTLVNGRRFVSSNAATIFGPANPGLQVDLNVIPTQLVDRIENLAIGGAPTYGSDAIAGVVNVILKEDYEGLEATATYGVTDRGDNDRVNLGVIYGFNFFDGLGNFTISASYDNSDGVLALERDRFTSNFSFQPNPLAPGILTQQPGRNPATDGRVNPNIPFNTGNFDGIPNAVLVRNLRFFTFTGGGLLLPGTGAINLAGGALRGFGPTSTTYLQFDTNGNIVPFNPGTNFGTSNAVGGDGFNLNETAQIISDLERKNINFTGRYGIGDFADLFVEGLYYNAEALELIDQPIFNVNLFGGLSAPILVPTNYAQLSDQARATLTGLGVTNFRLSRASRDLVNNNGSSESDTYRGVVGLKGDFDAFGRTFLWEVSQNWGRNDTDFFATVLNQQNFVNALNVVRNAAGQLVCTTTPVPGLVIPGPVGQAPVADPNCVPLDIFGEGRPSAAARDYVTDRTITRSVLDQRVFNANVGGSLFDYWAGSLGFNVGFEHRVEKGDFIPDAFQRAGRGRAVAILPNRGEFETDEWFAEVNIPLISRDWDLPLLKRFDITGKFRTVDNTVNGTFDTYTYGFQFRPFDEFEIRGNKTKSFRAPSIVELFTPVSSIFTTVPDPCDSRNVSGGTRPATRAANCAAFYQQFNIPNPASFQSTAVTATVMGTSGGDENLQNEEADAATIGVVWQPEYIDGLRVAIDYYKIDINNVIANLNATAIATGCFDNPDFAPGDVTQANEFCRRIIRGPDGQITNIRTGFVNGGFLDFYGTSADVQYTRDLEDWGGRGRVDFSANWFKLSRLESSTNNVVTNDDKGELGNPERAYQLGVAYTLDPISIGVQALHQSKAKFDNDFTIESRDLLSVGSYTQFNANVAWEVNEDVLVRLAITNLTDREPPFPTAGVGTYDILGRRYALTLDWRFQ